MASYNLGKDVIILSEEFIKETIMFLLTDLGEMYPLQINNGLKTMFKCNLDADTFLRCMHSLEDKDAITMRHPQNVYKIRKDFIDTDFSNIKCLIQKHKDLKIKYDNFKKEFNNRDLLNSI